MIRWLAAAAILTSEAALAQGAGKPVIDMHLHARKAGYAGADPMPMCAPFLVMPRSDPKNGIYEGMAMEGMPCADPIPAAKSDAEALANTLSAMRDNNIFAVVSGEPALIAEWVAKGGGRFIRRSTTGFPELRDRNMLRPSRSTSFARSTSADC